MPLRPLILPAEVGQLARPCYADEALLTQIIAESEREDIRPRIGATLFVALKSTESDADLTGSLRVLLLGGEWTDNSGRMHYLDGIKVALAYYTYGRVIRDGNITSTRYGAVIKSDDNSNSASDNAERQRQYRQAFDTADTMIVEAVNYITAMKVGGYEDCPGIRSNRAKMSVIGNHSASCGCKSEHTTIISGKEGPSAYDVAVANGFRGSVEDWLASLVGPQGPEGPQGPQGPSVSLDDYYDKPEVDALLADKASASDVDAAISEEAAARENGDQSLGTQIAALENNISESIGNIEDKVDDVSASLAVVQSDLETEQAARVAADAALGTRISNEEAARKGSDDSLSASIADEATKRGSEDSRIEGLIGIERNERAAADAALELSKQDAISDLETIRSNAQNASNTIASIVNAGYVFAGVATSSTNPGIPDAKVFYIANGKGTYTNFGSLEVTEDEVVVLYWDSAWHKISTGIASQAKLSELEVEIGIINLARLAESGETAFESGSINATGANNIALDCIRTANAIPTKYGAITVPAGWELYYVYYYESWVSNTNYTLSTRVDIHTKKTYTLDTTYNLARVIFRKESHPNITADEFLSALPTISALSQIRSSINTIDSKLDSLEAFDDGLKNGFIPIADLTPVWSSEGYYKANSTTLQSGGGYYTDAVDISQYAGNKLLISFNAITGVSVRACLITDSTDNILSSVEEKSFFFNPLSGFYEAVLDIVTGATKAYLSVSTSASKRISTVIKPIDGQTSGEAKSVVYVDPQNGNDNNSGTVESPFATFAKAIDSTGDDTTIVFTGETNEAVNIRRKSTQRTLRIIGKAGQKNRFSFGEKITSATLVSGDVYSVSRQTFPDKALFPLFQDGVPDTNTLIADGERLPMQRGREYRCDCSVLLPFGSLAELQASAGLGYYYDTTTSTLYFKVAPGTSLSSNPVIIPSGNKFCITGNNGSVKVELCNIDAYYCAFDLESCSGAKITNCSARYCVSPAGFMYDRSVGIRFVKCEASSVYSGDTGTGDGFNAHSTGGTYTTDDANMRTTSAELVDCWSHDCNDDGFSDHERCESVIRGGLFEYNGKGGITPSFGSHCSCYGVISRKNANGFFYIGSATTQEGGKYGQMYCENCLAIENIRSAGSSYNLHGGFVNSYRNGVGNRVVLVNCKAIGNSVGYYNATNNLMELMDCRASGNTTETSGTITKNNTSIVE